MEEYTILWADDEIGLLKPHILFLEQRGYRVIPVNSGRDAVDFCASRRCDVVFLDEHMPGISGLDALARIKAIKPDLPVVMITKDEEESVMEDAIGARVDDYLIKPLNRSQVLSAAKKITDNKRLIKEKTDSSYQQAFNRISAALQSPLNHAQWAELYAKIVFWELQLDSAGNRDMAGILKAQKAEANAAFCRFVKNNYALWINSPTVAKPLLSHRVMEERVWPQLERDTPCFMLVIDNLRWDQWETIKPILTEWFDVASEEPYYAILPTATAYARNALLAGMLPLDIARKYPNCWAYDATEGGNNHEEELIGHLLKRTGKELAFSYAKITKTEEGRALANSLGNLFSNDLNIIVYNFVDTLSHARTDMAVIQELAPDESAYLSLTRSWLNHSPLLDIVKKIAQKKARLVIATDHGAIRVKQACKATGHRDINANLRYKEGKNINCENAKALRCARPEAFALPAKSALTSYMFAVEDQFFAYSNGYRHHVKRYANTFQHGGISLEEMIVPLASLTPKEKR